MNGLNQNILLSNASECNANWQQRTDIGLCRGLYRCSSSSPWPLLFDLIVSFQITGGRMRISSIGIVCCVNIRIYSVTTWEPRVTRFCPTSSRSVLEHFKYAWYCRVLMLVNPKCSGFQAFAGLSLGCLHIGSWHTAVCRVFNFTLSMIH